MSKLHYLPLETMPGRYSEMMDSVLEPLADFTYRPPGFDNVSIRNGQFLDVFTTSQFKALQMAMVAACFRDGTVKSGDCFLVGDIFYPGLEALRYMAELSGVKIKIGAFNYAGMSDPQDFVQRLGPWAIESEHAWHLVADLVFVGSKFHQDQVCNYFNLPVHKVVDTGYAWSPEYVRERCPAICSRIPKTVIWPHRPCSEKGWGEFVAIAQNCPDHRFIITSSNPDPYALPSTPPPNVEYKFGLSKAAYYAELSTASLYLSTAYQETFGYTLHEAAATGSYILAPNRACYTLSGLAHYNLYESVDEAIVLIKRGQYFPAPAALLERVQNNGERIVNLLKTL